MYSLPFLDIKPIFFEKLPSKLYHTNCFQYGRKISHKDKALSSLYIQPNSKTHKYFLLFDVDRESGSVDWHDRGLPAPHIVVKNPHNGHAHLTYILDTSVKTDLTGSYRAIKYCADIELGLALRLGADLAYNAKLTKTPGHPNWVTYSFAEEPYTLSYLAEFIDRELLKKRKNLASSETGTQAYSTGRNCELFELIRHWAYKNRCKYTNYTEFCVSLSEQATLSNTFESMLSASELRQIVRSVSSWTWSNFDPERLSRLKSERARQSALKGGGRPKTTTSNGNPWDNLGVSRATWYRTKARENSINH